MNAKTINWLLLCVTLFNASHVVAATSEDFLLPSQTDSWWVSKGNRHNGRELHIKKFKSALSVESVIEFYKNSWRTELDIPGFMESSANGWRMISQLEQQHQWVVQVKPSQLGGGSEGMISLMPLQESSTNSAELHDGFTSVMNGGVVLSTNYSNRPEKSKTQTQVFSGRPASVANRIKSHVKSRGWTLQDEYSRVDSMAMRFEHSNRKLDIGLVGVPNVRTLVFISEVKLASK